MEKREWVYRITERTYNEGVMVMRIVFESKRFSGYTETRRAMLNTVGRRLDANKQVTGEVVEVRG